MSRKTIFSIALLVLLIAGACNIGNTTQQPTSAPTEIPATATPAGPQPVSSLEDVRSAVVQIVAEGSFVDPQEGEYIGAGAGTGFIIDPSGLVVTNNHVVTGAARLKVYVGGDSTTVYNARIVAVDECSDLALIDLEGEDYPFLAWYDEAPKVGMEVYAAGFPLGDPEYTLTRGIVSKEKANGESSWASIDYVIEHDATINPGNSGGPLVTSDGQVVGVNYATSNVGVNQFYAIANVEAKEIIEKLKNGENIDSIGINGEILAADDGSISGVWVYSVESGSAADKAGLKGGDFIIEMEGLPIGEDGTMKTYCDTIRTKGADGVIAIQVYRYATDELLEGQINGEKLSVVQSGSGYQGWSDLTNALYLEAPVSWEDTNGATWESTWGTFSFTAARLDVSPNLDDFYKFVDATGISFAASKDWGRLGGYIQLLDGTKSWNESVCNYSSREKFENDTFEGAYDVWDCGNNWTSYIYALRPKATPQAYLVLFQIQINENDPDQLDAVDQFLYTFEVDPTALP
jgi:serine protease Do